MDAQELFITADSALRHVIDRLRPDDLDRPAPQEWSRSVTAPTVRDILAAHAYDEAWIPDLLAGASAAEGDPWRGRDLLGDDPIASYDALQSAAAAAVAAGVGRDAVLRFSYGDLPVEEGLTHLATYRAFQAWSIAHLVGMDFRLGPALVAGLDEHVVPQIDTWRCWGVFPPAVEPPPGADAETLLLCRVGYWEP